MWLLVLLLLGSAALALAEFGFDMARISPEASATDHDPLARPPRRIAANTPASSSYASHHYGLRFPVPHDGASEEVLASTHATPTSSLPILDTSPQTA